MPPSDNPEIQEPEDRELSLSELLDAQDDDDELDGEESPQEGEPTPPTEEPKPGDADPKAEQPTFKVKVNGEEIEVSLDELKNGYQRQADYTRKTQEAADLKREAEATRQQSQAEIEHATAEREAYKANLAKIAIQAEAVVQQYAGVDWDSLAQENPAAYIQARHMYVKAVEAFNGARGQAEQLKQYEEQLAEEQNRKNLFYERDKLLEAIPEWKDSAKYEQEDKAISASLRSIGFTDEEIAGVSDHRAVILARKAMLFDAMMSQQQTTQKAARDKLDRTPPRALRPGSASPQDEKGSSSDEYRRASAALKKSGSIRDAGRALSALMSMQNGS